MFMAQVPGTKTCEICLRFCHLFLDKTLFVLYDIFIYTFRAYAVVTCFLVRTIFFILRVFVDFGGFYSRYILISYTILFC